MRVYAVTVLMLVVAACASTPPDRTEYLLRYESPSGVEAVPRQGAARLARVSVADYLTQPGLAVETAPNVVRSARDHLWAEPLEAGLTMYLRAVIAAQRGEAVLVRTGGGPASGPRISVFVEELHGTMTGEARLVAYFQVAKPGEEMPRDFRFARSVALERPGYAGLVEAERTLLDQLASSIAVALE